MKLWEYRFDQHSCTFPRRVLGSNPVTGRNLYGYSARCQCGWEVKTNENMAAVEKMWREHTREEWDRSRLTQPQDHR